MPKKRTTRRRRRRGGLVRLLRPLSVLLAAVAVVAALTLFFKVDKIETAGSARYQAEEIIAASGVERGDNLILLDRRRIAQRLYTELPYITQVQVTPQFPDTLLLEITETRAITSIQGAGGYWLLSAKGKLVEAAEESAAADYLAISGVDAVSPAGEAAQKAAEAGGDLAAVIAAACEGAAQGVEATKSMTPKFGKAAVFAAKAAGVADQGAVAGMYMIQGLKRGLEGL